MATRKDRILAFCRNMHSAVLRIVCILAGILVMGVEAFSGFYFLPMILTALTTFHTLDSDVDAQRTVRRQGSIGWQHLGYLVSLHLLASLLILGLYWLFITHFDREIAPGMLDMQFAKLYALIILGNVITPLNGVIKAKAPALAQEIVLRGHYAITLACIVGFALAGVEAKLVPYAWLIGTLATIALKLMLGIAYLARADAKASPAPLGSGWALDQWKAILAFSAARTDRPGRLERAYLDVLKDILGTNYPSEALR